MNEALVEAEASRRIVCECLGIADVLQRLPDRDAELTLGADHGRQ